MNNNAQKYEYMLHWWGGCTPMIKEKYGYESYMYFETPEEREKVIQNMLELSNSNLAIDKMEGFLTHKDTVACMTFKYSDKEFYYEYNFGKEYPEDSARFCFFEGNYSCDCNKSLFIRREYGDVIPDMKCGDNIKILNFDIQYK